MIFNYRDWHGMLPFSLHGYGTSVHASTGATPPTIPQYTTQKPVPHMEVRVPSTEVPMKAKLD